MNEENRNGQTSLADSKIEEEKLRQEKRAKLQKKYRMISIVLVGIIVISLVLLVMKLQPVRLEETDTQLESLPVETEPQAEESKSIAITADNWSEYFTISKEIVDTSLILDDAALYSMDTNHIIRLKDYWAGQLDTKKESTVNFSFAYKECMGLFYMDYEKLTYTEKSISAIKNCTADVVLTYPYPADNIIYTASILGGGESDDFTGLGFVGKEFTVTSADGVLYLKNE